MGEHWLKMSALPTAQNSLSTTRATSVRHFSHLPPEGILLQLAFTYMSNCSPNSRTSFALVTPEYKSFFMLITNSGRGITRTHTEPRLQQQLANAWIAIMVYVSLLSCYLRTLQAACVAWSPQYCGCVSLSPLWGSNCLLPLTIAEVQKADFCGNHQHQVQPSDRPNNLYHSEFPTRF